MNGQHLEQLGAAKAHFYACRLVDAYHLFRRFFDRIPFQVEKEHAEHIAMFVRVLWELGKHHELKFYLAELEKHREKSKDPDIAYTLAVIYRSLPEPQDEKARDLLEEIIRNPLAKEYQIKAKIALAKYYDWKRNDLAACRELIFSIQEPSDERLRVLWEIWKAKVLRDEKNFDEAERTLSRIFETVTVESDWYAYASAKIIEAILYLKKGALDKALQIANEVQALFENRNFKSLKVEIDELHKQIRERTEMGCLRLFNGPEKSEVSYEKQSLELKRSSPAYKLLTLLMRKRFVDKESIIRLIYDRSYRNLDDDKLVYYHIHALRTRLRSIGVPGEAISNESNGYRWVPKVEISGEELWN